MKRHAWIVVVAGHLAVGTLWIALAQPSVPGPPPAVASSGEGTNEGPEIVEVDVWWVPGSALDASPADGFWLTAWTNTLWTTEPEATVMLPLGEAFDWDITASNQWGTAITTGQTVLGRSNWLELGTVRPTITQSTNFAGPWEDLGVTDLVTNLIAPVMFYSHTKALQWEEKSVVVEE